MITESNGMMQDEPLLWEKGRRGRQGMSIPAGDVPRHSLLRSCVVKAPIFRT
jgi:hypothetical protein